MEAGPPTRFFDVYKKSFFLILVALSAAHARTAMHFSTPETILRAGRVPPSPLATPQPQRTSAFSLAEPPTAP